MENHEENPQNRARTWAFPALAVVVAVVLTLAAVEAGLRVYHHFKGTYRLNDEAVQARNHSVWIRSGDPLLIYRHRPDYVKMDVRHTESHGILRPEDIAMEKPRGVFRIALLGDSIGAALLLLYEERFGTQLERMLTASLGRRVEVVNFCVDGYKTAQEAKVLETFAGDFDPDLILIAYCMNDVANSFTPTVWFLDPTAPKLYIWKEISSRLNIGDASAAKYVPVFGPHYGPHRYWHELYTRDSEGWQSVLEGFDRIAWYSSVHSLPVLVTIFPFFLPDNWYQGGVEPLHAQVARAARSRGFEVMDLLPVFAVHDVDEVRDDPEDLFHPNARGHQVAARAIHDRILGLIQETGKWGKGPKP